MRSSTWRQTLRLTRSFVESDTTDSLTAGAVSTKTRIRLSSPGAWLVHIAPIRQQRGGDQGEDQHHEQNQDAVQHRSVTSRARFSEVGVYAASNHTGITQRGKSITGGLRPP